MISYIASRIDTILPFLQRKKTFHGEPSRSMPNIQFMELSNCWVRYLVCGEGERTIVIAPDSPVTMEAYGSVVEALSKDNRVVLFETPAFGFSVPKLGFNFSYMAWTETIAEFLRRLALGPYVLAIPCVAGLSAIGIARRYPEMVEAIVSTQTPAWHHERNWVRSWDQKGVMTWPFWAQALGHYFKTRKVHLIHKLITHQKRDYLMKLSQKTLAQGASNPLATSCQCYLLEKEPSWLGPVDVPAISIWGKADRSHDKSGTDRTSILRYLPHAKLIDFEDAGHFLEAEVPEKFAAVVDEFIKSLPARDKPLHQYTKRSLS
jgi:pimeloyl-ACP methyl ester carboxylesterase